MKKLAVTVPPYNSTLMGCVRGVSDAFGFEHSTPMLYGASGHAFLINIHRQICPSGPYCWDRTGFFALLKNLGLEAVGLGGLFGDPSPSERKAIEERLKAEIDAGRPPMLVNMEYQLVTGYDETGFDTTQAWPCADFPPRRLTYGTWAEMGGEIHVDFFGFSMGAAAPWEDAVRASLAFAVDLFREPKRYACEGYGIGPDAYRNWQQAVLGHGAGHGNWWNASVWGECRRRASEYFQEIGAKVDHALSWELVEDYRLIADHMEKVGDKEARVEAKLAALTEIDGLESEAIEKLEELAKAI